MSKLKIVRRVQGKPNMNSFDVSMYTDGHDVPALYIGDQIVELGSGSIGNYPVKDEQHLIWHLDEDKEYIVEIREAE